MREYGAVLLLSVFAAGLAAAQPQEPKALLRQELTGGAGGNYYIAVLLGSASADSGCTGAAGMASVQSTLFAGKTRILPSKVFCGEKYGADLRVELNNQRDQQALLGNYDKLTLVLAPAPPAGGGTSSPGISLLLPIALEVQTRIEVLTEPNQDCRTGFEINVGVKADKEDGQEKLTQYQHDRVALLLAELSKVKTFTADIDEEENESENLGHRKFILKEFGTKAPKIGGVPGQGTEYTRCVVFVPPLANRTLKFRLSLGNGTAPPELRKPLVAKLDKVRADDAPFALAGGEVGSRPFERNLDLGVQFTSSVSDVEVGSKTVRERSNSGSLDLRFAPLLNLLTTPKINDRLFIYWTPFAADAQVSTGAITKANLATNRITVSSEFELRLIPEGAGFDSSLQRLILGVRNHSDRDFKQAEAQAFFEYRPIIRAVNRPLSGEAPRREPWVIDPDPTLADQKSFATRRFGYEVLPVFGFEFGRAYRNRRREAARLSDETVKRGYLGGVVALDLGERMRLSAQDLLFIRGESEQDRYHNYFKATFEFILPTFAPLAAHSTFFSFERGNQPPFATPDVNVLKVGYRIQLDGWFRRSR